MHINDNKWMVVVLIIAGLQLTACQAKSNAPTKIEPAQIEHIEGTVLNRLVLSDRARERLGIETTPVDKKKVSSSLMAESDLVLQPVAFTVETASGGEVQTEVVAYAAVVPYSAVLYDPQGDTWVYTAPQPGSFVRHQISVDYIEGDLAFLSDGPPAGTEVVAVGAAELFGTEFDIGH